MSNKEVLTKLAGDADWKVRRFVACNSNVSKEALVKLAGDANWSIRDIVAIRLNKSLL